MILDHKTLPLVQPLQQYYFSCISSWSFNCLNICLLHHTIFCSSKIWCQYVGLTRRGLYGYNHHVNGNNNGNQPPSSNIVNEHTFAQIFTTTEVQDQLDYIRQHHYLRGEIIDRRLNQDDEDSSNDAARQRQQQRRRRNKKKKKRWKICQNEKLTAEEVELLFPKKLIINGLMVGKKKMLKIRRFIL